MKASTYFAIKKLHSLSGLLPVGGFVGMHLFENARSLQGAAAYNELTATLRSLPLLYLLEAGLLGGLAFHALFGIILAFVGRPNNIRFPARANAMYLLQRVTGAILLIFITLHLYLTRFAGIPSDQMFQTLARDYQNPLVFGIYVAGILSAAFHLGNGLWGFSISWGIVTGQKSQDHLWKACMGVAALLALYGINALLGFNGHALSFLQPEHAGPAVQALAR